MPAVETTLIIGTAVAKSLLKLWLKDNPVAEGVGGSVIDLLKSKVADRDAQRRGAQLFEQIGREVASSLKPLFAGSPLTENGQLAVAYEIGTTLESARISPALLARKDLNPQELAKYLRDARPEAKRDLTEAEASLYNRVLDETARRITQIASSLPAFAEVTLGEVLQREAALLGKVDEILRKLAADSANYVAVAHDLSKKLDAFLSHLNVRSIRETFAVSVSAAEDRRLAQALISDADELLQSAGMDLSAENYYGLGLVQITLGQLEQAASSFLAATGTNPDLYDAYWGLGVVYQLQANEMIRRENYGLAEDALNKAEEYVKAALRADPANASVLVQLGYISKDLAQRYSDRDRGQRAAAHSEKAEQYFKMALGANEHDASAHNGLGSLYLIRGDYKSAIKECRRAIQLEPTYLFAYFDLASAYYGMAATSTNRQERRRAMTGFSKAAERVVALDGVAGNLPPAARQNLIAIAEWMEREAKNLAPGEAVEVATPAAP
jgi:tetratricopeptide (TPR) repeat protein